MSWSGNKYNGVELRRGWERRPGAEAKKLRRLQANERDAFTPPENRHLWRLELARNKYWNITRARSSS